MLRFRHAKASKIHKSSCARHPQRRIICSTRITKNWAHIWRWCFKVSNVRTLAGSEFWLEMFMYIFILHISFKTTHTPLDRKQRPPTSWLIAWRRNRKRSPWRSWPPSSMHCRTSKPIWRACATLPKICASTHRNWATVCAACSAFSWRRCPVVRPPHARRLWVIIWAVNWT